MGTGFSFLLLLVVMTVGCGCGDKRVSGHLDGGTGTDSGVLEGGVDGAEVPDASQYDFCGQSFYKLPIDGPTEAVYGHDLWANKLVYAKAPVDLGPATQIHLFDLSSCTESQLTREAVAVGPSVWGDLVVWNDYRVWSQSPEYYCSDLFGFDLAASSEVRLSEDPQCESQAHTNGQYISYPKYLNQSNSSPQQLVLWDLETDVEVDLAPPSAMVAYHDISERYVVWSGYSADQLSIGRDVFYHDIQLDNTARVEYSTAHFTYNVRVSGGHLVYLASDQYSSPPWHLVLYDIATEQALLLTENDHAIPVPVIHENLVAWPTSFYSGTLGSYPADIEMFDTRSGVRRRITTQEGNLGPVGLFFPHLIVVNALHLGNDHLNDWYVVNLVESGVTDGLGNIIPGDPVLDPP